ncbi:hypothetical protein V1264_015183 [Littorina saxatilis]|uniref:Uncharacterized protein n=1 Tax=Littorina saxatilis TaxID=31220 RepID=A0AAN9BKN8_9CAEN
MGNKSHRDEIVFMNHERTTRIFRPDGTELYMHKNEVIDRDKLKHGHYVAEKINTATGEKTFHLSLTTGQDKGDKTQPASSSEEEDPNKGPPRHPHFGQNRDKPDLRGSSSSDDGPVLKALPEIDDITPITGQPLSNSARAACDNKSTSSQTLVGGGLEAGPDSDGGTKLDIGDDHSAASTSSNNPDSKAVPGTSTRKSDVDTEDTGPPPRKSSFLVKTLAIFGIGKEKSKANAKETDTQGQDNFSSECSSADGESINSKVCIQVFKSGLAEFI